MQERVSKPTNMRGVNGRVFRRSFFLETLWNYEKMQNVGFIYCFFPALERLYSDEGDRRAVVNRHLDPVNTHPSMGPLLAGLTARLEHDLEASTVIPYRKRVMATLAAYGDRIFWSHVKPLASVIGSIFGFILFGSIVGSVVLLVTYNVPHLFLRARGFKIGWTEGLQVLLMLKSPGVTGLVTLARDALSLGLGLLAGVVVYLAVKAPDSVYLSRPFTGICLVIAASAGFVMLRKRVSPATVIYLIALGTLSVFLISQTGNLFV
ncbi:MAG: PTS system mannose/fructose/sorbose family transporter subunit IID [Desulfomonile tiedjei]|uniref:PTS system mannose/fructose/sorbose family transporter subunit IID n=1 Tax=Desulfomonile tiedjei TaxID=2358 RepID=A0A9D6V467_9BACT|nr:PTS system mannose/fructose/sorbose family transporter subunit IID [Desulfomonile tiedjei]